MPTPQEIAVWRFEQIAPFVDESLTPVERKKAIKQRARVPVVWPSGEEKPVPRSSLYRWWSAYRKTRDLAALMPRQRKDRGASRTVPSWIEKAIQFLLERPRRSLVLLLGLLATVFPDLVVKKKPEVVLKLKRSTLDRALRRHKLWPLIVRMRKGTKRLRRRFQARRAHDIWQLDGKGPFLVRLASGEQVSVTVLTILDDHSRAVLGVVVATSECLGAAVRLFRDTAGRWGLPFRVYCDRHSAYDSDAFRTGLAELGVNRIRSRARNPPARGKIEAYHRVLIAWFIEELGLQQVLSLLHLEQLLLAVIELLYQTHRHRTIRTTPAVALDGQRSERTVTVEALRRAFWTERTRKAHPKSGEIDNLPGGPVRVPEAYAGKIVVLRIDPAEPTRVVLVGNGGCAIPLRPLFSREPEPVAVADDTRGAGCLQRFLDIYRGRALPLSAAGFGLPEVLDALTKALGRTVPATEDEALAVQAFCRDKGPFEPTAFDSALAAALAALGQGRPVQVVLDYLSRLVAAQSARPEQKGERP
jgi:transposase InsO family protein